MQASNGLLYGTTLGGGTNGQGTVFKLTTTGTLTTLYSFCAEANCADGSEPVGGLVQGTDGNLYGVTEYGGGNGPGSGAGTVFKVTPAGKLTTIYKFCSLTNCTDGENPVGGMVP